MQKVIHLIDDARVGGVLTGLQRLIAPDAQLPGKHEVQVVNSANPISANAIIADTIVVHFSIAWRKLPFLVLLRVKNPTSKLILQEHHYCAEHLARRGTPKVRFEELFRLASMIFDRVLAVSEAQARWLRTLGVRVDMVVAPMADLSELLEIPVRSPREQPIVGVSGRFCREKGIDLLIELLARPAASSFRFLIAGYGELEKEVAFVAERSSNVEFMGRYDNPREFLSRCDVVLIPSRQETFGLNCLEAKAAGKPVVVTRCSGLTEQAASCGVVVEGNDAGSLIRGLRDLHTLPQLEKLGERARDEAEKHNELVQSLWYQALSEENA